MTAPNGDAIRPAAAPAPSPKVQAVTLAIELAKVRATSEQGRTRATSVEQLLSDAEAIASFIGTPSSVTTRF